MFYCYYSSIHYLVHYTENILCSSDIFRYVDPLLCFPVDTKIKSLERSQGFPVHVRGSHHNLSEYSSTVTTQAIFYGHRIWIRNIIGFGAFRESYNCGAQILEVYLMGHGGLQRFEWRVCILLAVCFQNT